MTLNEYIVQYDTLKVKERTEVFNQFEVKDRLKFLETLSETDKKKFIKDIRNQAVKDFWWHEREKILNGECTRDWTPEQIENIMNIKSDGKMSSGAGKGLQVDDDGVILIDKHGNKSFYGHHMVDVSTHPEYAGEWRNIQALDYEEHYNGAHKNHDTKTPTKGYYDISIRDTITIDVTVAGFKFEDVKYPEKKTCIFKSNADMEKLYSGFSELTAGEQLAFKNVDLALSTADINRFHIGIKLAEKYNSTDFEGKMGLTSEVDIKQKYGILKNCENPNVIAEYQFYEYATRHGYEMDVEVYVDANGNVLGTSLNKDYVPQATDYTISMKDTTQYHSTAELKSHITSNAMAGGSSGTASGNTTTPSQGSEAEMRTDSESDTSKATETDTRTGADNDTSTGTDTRTGTDTETSTGTDTTNQTDTTRANGDTDTTGRTNRDWNAETNPQPTQMSQNYDNSNTGEAGSNKTQSKYSKEAEAFFEDFQNKTGVDLKADTPDADIPKVNGALKALDVVGDGFDVVDAAVTIYKAANLFNEGKVDEASKMLRDYGWGTLGGMGGGALAATIAGTLALGPIGAIVMALGGGILGSLAGEGFSDWLDSIFGTYDEAGAYYVPVDPLILDLDGDGAETISADTGVYFDFDNNGFAEKIGWVGADDGLLVRDNNQNGIIDNGSELMGDLTQLADGTTARNGFEALASFDLNGDGVIDSQDAIFDELRIWQDKNGDGITDDGELSKLGEKLITSINLDYQNVSSNLKNGNTCTQKSSYTTATGSSGEIVDVWFAKNAQDTILKNGEEVILEETEEVMKLPDIEGIGNLYSLHQAMLRSEELQQIVTQYVAEENTAARRKLVRQMIYVWTGVSNTDPGERGSGISDARILGALEVFTGREFVSRYGSNPVSQAGVILEQAFGKLENMVFARLEMQTSCLPLYNSMMSEVYVDENDNIGFGTDAVMEYITKICEEDADVGKEVIADFVSNMISVGMTKYVDYDAFCDEIADLGEEYARVVYNIGDDRIYGSDENDTLNGERGDDIILAAGGENVITGGAGNDILVTENGVNTYYFDKHHGTDIILNHQTEKDDPLDALYPMLKEDMNKIVFGEGIASEDISTEKVGSSLYIKNVETGDLVVVWNHYREDGLYRIDTMEFADGTVRYFGTNKVTVCSSGDGGNTGTSSQITFKEIEIDETFESTKENNYFSGGIGVDTYIFDSNAGNDRIINSDGTVTRYLDKIQFDSSVSSEDIAAARINNDLVLKNTVSDATITVSGYFSSESNVIENIEFADGTLWRLEDIKERVRNINGTEENESLNGYAETYGYNPSEFFYAGAGNDSVNAQAGDDFIDGGSGDDTLRGGTGNDTYFFRLGDGNDYIEDHEGIDKLIFDEGIKPEDMIVSRDQYNLYLTNKENGHKIKIWSYFSQSSYAIEKIAFADGTVWDGETLKDKARHYYGTSNGEILTDYDTKNVDTNENASIYAGDGNDTLHGLNGNDSLYGEEGNDNLYGGNDDDLLSGGAGNDLLYAGTGENILYGGKDSDNLFGGAEDDMYYFEAGDGQDYITESGGGEDSIVFGKGVKAEDIQGTRDQYNLYLQNTITGDSIRVNSFFSGENYQIESVKFADGTEWDLETIHEKARYYYGTENNDILKDYNAQYVESNEDAYIYAGAGNDFLHGNEGNDSLCGEEGNDYLYGGNGDDYLSGGAGNDNLYGESGDNFLYGGTGSDNLSGMAGNSTYYFEAGDGQDYISESAGGEDSIVFGEGVKAEDIKGSRDQYNLYLQNTITGDSIRVNSFFSGANYQIESVKFADGTEWDLETINEKARYYYGTENNDILKDYNAQYVKSNENSYIYAGAGNDSLYGNEGNDSLYGEEGSDYLYGGNGDDYLSGGIGNDNLYGESGDNFLYGGTGNDNLSGTAGNSTYYFEAGDGQDVISESAGGEDSIVFGKGVKAEDIQGTRDQYHLYLKNTITGDSIRVNSFFSGENYQIESVKFSDGTEWDLETINEKARYYYGTENNDILKDYNAQYVKSNENSYIYAGAGNDSLYGNEGNDSLYGEEGNDYLYGGNGDDYLSGGIGNDNLYGESGDNFLYGGTGNDNLSGTAGNSTYYFEAGDGQDYITESAGGEDSIVFGEGVKAEDIKGSRDQYNLYLQNTATGDNIRVNNFFYGENFQIESVKFADGTEWDLETINEKARYYYGTENAEILKDYNAQYVESNENSYIYAGAGNDSLYGNEGNDSLYGEEGSDYLYGGNGDDYLSGGIGNDNLYGESGDNFLYGGTGNDNLSGTAGNSTYYFEAGDGQDYITESAGGEDSIVFGEGVKAEDIKGSRDQYNLYLQNTATGDNIRVNNFFYGENFQIESVKFADGTEWDLETIHEKARYYYGTENNDILKDYNAQYVESNENSYIYAGAGNDSLYGNEGNDSLYGEEGSDYLYGGNGDDYLSGGAGNDNLYGESGDNFLYGGTGSDNLSGMAGNSTYYFEAGDGQDYISESAGGEDSIVFGEGVKAEDIKFSKSSNSLIIQIVGSDNKITVNNHFYNEGSRVELFKTADGVSIDYTKVQLMIQAMASFEDSTGMMWEEAIESKNEAANDIVNQWWTKDAM